MYCQIGSSLPTVAGFRKDHSEPEWLWALQFAPVAKVARWPLEVVWQLVVESRSVQVLVEPVQAEQSTLERGLQLATELVAPVPLL